LFAYEASQVGRHAADRAARATAHPSDVEPTSSDVARWRDLAK